MDQSYLMACKWAVWHYGDDHNLSCENQYNTADKQYKKLMKFPACQHGATIPLNYAEEEGMMKEMNGFDAAQAKAKSKFM